MQERIVTLWPEIALFITTCIVMVTGLSHSRGVRSMCAPLSAVGLAVAGLLAIAYPVQGHTAIPNLPVYGKVMVAVIGLLMVLLLSGTADRELEEAVDNGRPFEPLRSVRAEFWSFFLFSLTGLMLCAGADDLIWLFLALELTSLPTYVMVAISTSRNRSMEAGVKYFFLGALGAAMFLYGFALIYGGTGHTGFAAIREVMEAQVASGGGINAIAMLGLVLAVIGVCFKIAAVPMHFYTPDVYQGSSASVAGFLAFTPKAAGFFALMLLCSLPGWHFAAGMGDTTRDSLPELLRVLLIVLAVLTMTVGNVLAILQNSVKRILAYSSIAHSGYMLVGLVAGPGPASADFTRNGLAAIMFYMFSYGVMTIGAFAVVAALEKTGRNGERVEADDIDDFRGLALTRPVLGWTMVICSMGLLGLPPLLGFIGKLPLFTSGISANEIPLVLVLGVNSAIAAYYYLRLAYVCFIESPETVPNAPKVEEAPFVGRRVAGAVSMAGVVLLAVLGGKLGDIALRAGKYDPRVTPPKHAETSSAAKADALTRR